MFWGCVKGNWTAYLQFSNSVFFMLFVFQQSAWPVIGIREYCTECINIIHGGNSISNMPFIESVKAGRGGGEARGKVPKIVQYKVSWQRTTFFRFPFYASWGPQHCQHSEPCQLCQNPLDLCGFSSNLDYCLQITTESIFNNIANIVNIVDILSTSYGYLELP